MQQFPALENSTRLLIFASALGCRASVNFDISSDFFPLYIQIVFVMQNKCNFKIFQGLPQLMKHF